MTARAALRLVVAAAIWAAAAAAAQAAGTLVIAGGALKPDNTQVYRAFIDAMPDPRAGVIVVIPSASAEPAQSAEAFRQAIAGHGVGPERVIVAPLATEDDPSTPAVNEALWRENGRDRALAARVASAGAVWFTGGDQARTMRVLLGADGRGGRVLDALRTALARGAVLGGTSAGAAVMSETMIGGGSSLTALIEPPIRGADPADSGALVLARGAGFFPFGVVDQHFDRRARLGRLVRALGAAAGPRMGFGVDEDTALVADLDRRVIRAVGRGYVTWVDGRRATFSPAGGPFSATGLQVAMISGGDQLSLPDGSVAPAAYKTPLAQSDGGSPSATGIAVPYRPLDELLGEDLVANGAAELDLPSFRGDGRGVRYRFGRTPATQGFAGTAPSGERRRTLVGLRLDVLPVRVRVEPLPQGRGGEPKGRPAPAPLPRNAPAG